VSTALSLQRFPLMHTHSLEEATQVQSSTHGRLVTEVTERRGVFEWEANMLRLGELAIVASRYGAAVRGKTDSVEVIYSLIVPQRAGGVGTQAHRSVVLAPGQTAALLSPAMSAEMELATGYSGLSVRMPGALLETTLDALTGVQRCMPLRFDMSVDLTRGGGAACLRLLEFIIAEAEHESSVLRTPIVESRLADAFVSALLLGLPHNHSHLLRTSERAPEPRYIKRAEQFLEANAHRPITVVELARVAGVSMRALQAGFRSHRGSTPFEFLRERRYALSRARLQASAADTVAEVAIGSGFEHLGRFSVGYRKRYGESPAETLRRARSEHAGQALDGTWRPKQRK
jgi:AraC-like DNA-binding protein